MKDRFFRIYTLRSSEIGRRTPHPGSVVRILVGLVLLTVFLFLMLALGWIVLLAGILFGLPWMFRAWWSAKRGAGQPESRDAPWIEGQWKSLDLPASLSHRDPPPDGKDVPP